MTKIHQQAMEQGCKTGFAASEVFGEKIEKYDYIRLPEEHDHNEERILHHSMDTERMTVRAFWETGDPVGFTLSKPDSAAVKKAFSTVYGSYLPGQKENFRHLLPGSVQKTRVSIFDDNYRSVDPNAFSELTDKIHEVMISPMFQRLKLNKIHLSRVLKKTYIVNSNHLDTKYKRTLFTLQLSVTLGENRVDISDNRVFFQQIDPFKIISRAYNLLHSLTEAPLAAEPRQNVSLILSPEASATLLKEFSQYFHTGAADDVKNIPFPSILNIIDDPIMDHMPGTVPFDDEGVQSGEKYLLQKGVVNETVSNLSGSFRYKKKPTGNGFRNGRSPFPAVRFSNLYIKPTVLPLKNLMNAAGEGVLVSLLKLKTIDRDSYLFSAYGYRFRGDDMMEPVHFYFRTTFRSYFLNILKVSKEIRFFYSTANIGSPYVLLEAKNRPDHIWEI